jgi:hypothetical protein
MDGEKRKDGKNGTGAVVIVLVAVAIVAAMI